MFDDVPSEVTSSAAASTRLFGELARPSASGRPWGTVTPPYSRPPSFPPLRTPAMAHAQAGSTTVYKVKIPRRQDWPTYAPVQFHSLSIS